jgi:hypothetical protein
MHTNRKTEMPLTVIGIRAIKQFVVELLSRQGRYTAQNRYQQYDYLMYFLHYLSNDKHLSLLP